MTELRLQQLRQLEPLNKVPARRPQDLRLLTFNVNGCKTLFKYHPWTELQNNYDDFLESLDADIVSLQELKVQLDALNPLGLLKKYRAFISIPKLKKGYSGVALFVRRAVDGDLEQKKQFLTVVKAEEGITGRLRTRNGLKLPFFQLPPSESIGGYVTCEDLDNWAMTEETMLNLDSEGRCAVVELASNVVVFSLYCPANSMGTDEGQEFRLQFLEVLLRRCQNLKKMGKEVVIMGDINVSMDLIDNAECINTRIKQKIVVNNLSEGGELFEEKNIDECLAFRSSASQRTLLNRYTFPTMAAAPTLPTHFLHDTTRLVQKRKLAIYSVWNTLTSARQSNYGSRIDLILLSCTKMVDNLVASDILPFLYGSDHCPVYTDIDTKYIGVKDIPEEIKLNFEAKVFHKLVKHRDISSMFGSMSRKSELLSEETPQPEKKRKVEYTSRKKQDLQQLIKNFFFGERNPTENLELPVEPIATPKASIPTVKLNSVAAFASLVYNDPPNCKHGEPCCLKTSLTKESKGKKFWCCARASKGSSDTLGDHRCEYFEWAKVNKIGDT